MANATTTEMREVTLRAGEWIKNNAPIIQKAWEEKNRAQKDKHNLIRFNQD